MTQLLAIGYPDIDTGPLAKEEVERYADDLTVQADAVAVVIRDGSGKFKTITNALAVEEGAAYGMIWGPLFAILFFVPFLGMDLGAGLRALMKRIEEAGIDERFQTVIRELLKPGTSALFMIVEDATMDGAVRAIAGFGGTVVTSPFPERAQTSLQEALHGPAASEDRPGGEI